MSRFGGVPETTGKSKFGGQVEAPPPPDTTRVDDQGRPLTGFWYSEYPHKDHSIVGDTLDSLGNGATKGLMRLPSGLTVELPTLAADVLQWTGGKIAHQFGAPKTKWKETLKSSDWAPYANVEATDSLFSDRLGWYSKERPADLGRYVDMIGEVGAGAKALGGLETPAAARAAVYSGIAGQAAKDAGAPAWVQGGASLLGGVAPSLASRALTPRTTLDQANLAESLMNRGVPVAPGYLATNRFTKNLYDMAKQLSIYENGFDENQANAVGTLMGRTMGENTDNLHEAVADATRRMSGQKDPAAPFGPKAVPGEYDETYARIGDHPIHPDVQVQLNIARNRAGALTDTPARDTILGAIDRIQNSPGWNGTISLDNFKLLTDKNGVLDTLANSQNPTVAAYGSSLRNLMHQNLIRQARNPADAVALQRLDSQWANMQTLRSHIARNADSEGHVSTTGLQGVIGDNPNVHPVLRDIASAGKSFLRPPRSSGTAERTRAAAALTGEVGTGGLIGGALGQAAGVGALGPAAIGAAGLTALPLAVRYVLENPALARAMIEKARRVATQQGGVHGLLNRAAPGARQAGQRLVPTITSVSQPAAGLLSAVRP